MHTLRTKWKVDEPTEKKRVYSRKMVEDAIKVYMDDMTSGNKGGYVVDETDWYGAKKDLGDMTHIVKDLRIEDDGRIAADFVCLKTQQGHFLEQLVTAAPELFTLNLLCMGTTIEGDEVWTVGDLQIEKVNVAFEGSLS